VALDRPARYSARPCASPRWGRSSSAARRSFKSAL